MESYSASVATRGVIHSNTSRAFAHQQGGMGFRPLHKPQWFLINKKVNPLFYFPLIIFSPKVRLLSSTGEIWSQC